MAEAPPTSDRSGGAPASFARRIVVSARALAPEQRRVVLAAVLVLASMFLPWYSKGIDAITKSGLASEHQSKLAITVPSFVEASIFLVAVALLVLMYARGQRRAFHLPFGDGVVVTAAGAWTGLLIFYRFTDQPSGGISDSIHYDYSLSWGIFFALLAALFLIYSGARLRLAGVEEPPLDEPQRERRPRPDVPTEVAAPPITKKVARRPDVGTDTQLSFDEPET